MRNRLFILFITLCLFAACGKAPDNTPPDTAALQAEQEQFEEMLAARRLELLKEYQDIKVYNQFPCLGPRLYKFTEGCKEEGAPIAAPDNRGLIPYIVKDIIPADLTLGCAVLQLEGAPDLYIAGYEIAPHPASTIEDFEADPDFLPEDFEGFAPAFPDDGIIDGFTKNDYQTPLRRKLARHEKAPLYKTATPAQLYQEYQNMPEQDRAKNFYRKYKDKKIKIIEAKILKVYPPYCGYAYLSLTSDGETRHLSIRADGAGHDFEEGQTLTFTCFADYASNAPNPVMQNCRVIK